MREGYVRSPNEPATLWPTCRPMSAPTRSLSLRARARSSQGSAQSFLSFPFRLPMQQVTLGSEAVPEKRMHGVAERVRRRRSVLTGSLRLRGRGCAARRARCMTAHAWQGAQRSPAASL